MKHQLCCAMLLCEEISKRGDFIKFELRNFVGALILGSIFSKTDTMEKSHVVRWIGIRITPCRWQVVNMEKTAVKYEPHQDYHNTASSGKQCYDLKEAFLTPYGTFDSCGTTCKNLRVKYYRRSNTSCYVNIVPFLVWIVSAGKSSLSWSWHCPQMILRAWGKCYLA